MMRYHPAVAQGVGLGIREGRFILLATLLASGVAFLMGTAVVVALPSIQSYFESGVAGIQWVISSQLLTLTAFLLVGGAIGDRYGRKRSLVVGILAFAGGSALSALAPTISLLIAFQAVQGVGAALMIPQSLAIINASFLEEKRGQVIGLWASLSGGIAALGPWIGGWLTDTWGWRAVFILPVPILLAAALVTIRHVPETRRFSNYALDWRGTILVLLGLLSLSYGLVMGPERQWTDPSIIAALLAAAAFLAAYAAVERREPNPLVPGEVVRNTLVVSANVVTLLVYLVLNGVIVYLTLNLQQLQNLTASRAGLALLPPVIIITIFAGPAGALADRIGPRIQMIWGPGMVGLGAILLAFTPSQAIYARDVLPGLLALGVGMALTIAPLTKSALAVREELSGAASGLNNAISRLAALLAVAILGAVLVTSFGAYLESNLTESSLSLEQQELLLARSDRLADMEVPEDFDDAARAIASSAIDGAFVGAFRNAMILSGVLALLSALVSFIYIKPSKGGGANETCTHCHPVPSMRIPANHEDGK